MKDADPARTVAREEFLTARQLAGILQVSESTVRRLAREGRIPSVRLTQRLVRFRLAAVLQALDGTARPASRRKPDEHEPDDSQLTFAEML